jgi:GntR family transcriptional regulator, transcriptional repressor for pyruvate dehydrogenase complex
MIKSPPSEAARRIRQYIVHHGLKAGDQLPTHDELSERLSVRPGRLREGLSILRHQGLIETRNKAGTIVRQSSYKALGEPISWHLDDTGYKFEDLVTARACLESSAAAEAAEKRSARDLLTILDALEQLEKVADATTDDVAEDEAFHLAIMRATHNPVIVTFGQLIRLQFQGKSIRSEPANKHRADNREHRSIYEAIERRDRTGVRDMMYAHVMGQLTVTSRKKARRAVHAD